jgi:hypothetical protein
VFTEIPEHLLGTEWLRVAANSRTLQADTAQLTANEDIFVYVGIDARRISEDLTWLIGADSAWESTGMTVSATDQTAPDGPGIVYNLYRIALAKDETLRLGTNGPSGSVIMYTVFFWQEETEEEPVHFIERACTVNECSECGEEKSLRTTHVGYRLGRIEEITQTRQAAKRSSTGRLLEGCCNSLIWNGRE